MSVNDKLSGIARRVEALTGEIGTPDGASADQILRMKAQQAERMSMIAQEIAVIQNLVTQEEYEQAQQGLLHLARELPPDFRRDLVALADKIKTDGDRLKTEGEIKWQADVAKLVIDAKNACLAAKISDDMTAILAQCSALQTKRQRDNNTVISQRTQLKLQGVVELLTAWTCYLDQLNAKNTKQANAQLRGLLDNASRFPILSTEEILTRMQTVPLPPEKVSSSRDVCLTKIFEGVKTPDDLPSAQKRLKEMAEAPVEDTTSSTLLNQEFRDEQPRLNSLIQFHNDTLNKTLRDNAMFKLGAEHGSDHVTPYYANILPQLFRDYIQYHSDKLGGVKPEESESPESYLTRVLDGFFAKEQFEEIRQMLKAIADCGWLSKSDLPGGFALQGVSSYLTAQKLEEAGDLLPAINHYRVVIELPPTKYVPSKQTAERLRALQASHPDLFKDVSGALLNDIKSLRMEVKMLTDRVQMLLYQIRK